MLSNNQKQLCKKKKYFKNDNTFFHFGVIWLSVDSLNNDPMQDVKTKNYFNIVFYPY